MRILILFLLSSLPQLLHAQHNHYIYIQGDDQQNFYIRKSGEVMSSSASGFIIVPRLQPGTHQFVIGFPKDQFPEYEFQLEVKDKDRGFTLKNFQDKGWGLFDMQTMEVIMGTRIEKKKEVQQEYGSMSDDPFSVILASVVDDPRIREISLVNTAAMVSAPVMKPADKPVVSNKETKPVTTTVVKPAEPVKTSPVAEQKSVAVEEKKPAEEAGKTTAPPVAAATQTTTLPTEVTAKTDTKPETAKPATEKKEVLVPVTVKTDSQKTTAPAVEANAEKYVAQKVRKISELKTWTGYEITYIDYSGPVPDTIHVSIEDTVNAAAAANGATDAVKAEDKTKMPRTDCKNMAREKDVLAIRKKMLMMANETEMVDFAVKELRNKCFTVEQVQNLSYVFVNDSGRFQLFEQAYPFIFDPANYHRLEKLLNSDEYTARFRTLIK